MPGPRSLDPREWQQSRRTGWPSAWDEYERDDPAGSSIQVALAARIGSLDLLAATGHLDLVTSSGETRAYLPVLVEDIEVEESYEPGSGSTGARTVSVSIPNAVVSVVSLVAAGLLVAGEGEIALAFPGCPFEARRVLLDGDVTGGVSFGDAGEPVEFELSDPSDTAGYLVTPHVVDTDTWPDASEDAIGQRYPLVFNQWDRVPTLLVDAQKCLVAVSGGGVDAASVAVYVDGELKSSGNAAYGHAVAVEVDRRGVSYVAINFTGTETIDDEDVRAAVTVASGDPQYLHELVESMLLGYTALGRRRVSFDLIGDLRARLGSVPVKLLVNGSGESTAADAFAVLEDRVATSFPMICFGFVDGRYGPIVTDGRAPSRADLVEGVQLLRRASSVQESDKRDMANRFTVRHSYDTTADTYTGVATRDPSTSVLCARSEAVAGERYADVVDADLLYRQADAEMVVDWLAYHNAMPSYLVEYDVPILVALKYRPGLNVTLFLPSLGFSSGILATVVSRRFRRGAAGMGFRLWWANVAGAASGGGASSTSPSPSGGH